MTSETATCEPPVPVPRPLHLPRGDLGTALNAIDSALTQLHSAQDVRWQSVAATHYQRQLDEAIGQVRRVRALVQNADADWVALQNVARANGQW